MLTNAYDIDRLAMRGRPEGMPIMQQTWENLLFLHWAFSPKLLRPLIPARLEIDTFDEMAWVGLTPFDVSGLKLTGMPLIPGTSTFHELNLRTYVHLNGIPGIWFFTLEASKVLPTIGARSYFSLPYRKAEMNFQAIRGALHFQSHRKDNVNADFEVQWHPGQPLPEPAVASLEFFLVERYCLFAAEGETILQSRIYHAPWALRAAELFSLKTSMLEWLGLPQPIAAPLVHFADIQHVEVWAPEEV